MQNKIDVHACTWIDNVGCVSECETLREKERMYVGRIYAMGGKICVQIPESIMIHMLLLLTDDSAAGAHSESLMARLSRRFLMQMALVPSGKPALRRLSCECNNMCKGKRERPYDAACFLVIVRCSRWGMSSIWYSGSISSCWSNPWTRSQNWTPDKNTARIYTKFALIPVWCSIPSCPSGRWAGRSRGQTCQQSEHYQNIIKKTDYEDSFWSGCTGAILKLMKVSV